MQKTLDQRWSENQYTISQTEYERETAEEENDTTWINKVELKLKKLKQEEEKLHQEYCQGQQL